MQNLKPFIAQCYRGGRSIGNRQSRGFSSTPNKNGAESMKNVATFVLMGCLILKNLDTWKLFWDIKKAEDLAAKHGKKVRFRIEINHFKPHKVQAQFYDDQDVI